MTYEQWKELYESYSTPAGGWLLSDYERAEWYDMVQTQLAKDYSEYAGIYYKYEDKPINRLFG